MKNITSLFFVSLIAMFVSGCAFTPKQISAKPVGTDYTFGQEPKKRAYEDKGLYVDENARALQQMALEHERRMTAMTYAAKEREEAKRLGLPVPTPPVIASTTVARPAPAKPPGFWGSLFSAQVYYVPASGYIPAQYEVSYGYVSPGTIFVGRGHGGGHRR
jgi:hypothetical protein